MKVQEIGVSEAKTQFSELLKQVSRGRTYRITRRGKPIAELRPIQQAQPHPRFGAHRGRIVMREDFDDPLPEFKKYT